MRNYRFLNESCSVVSFLKIAVVCSKALGWEQCSTFMFQSTVPARSKFVLFLESIHFIAVKNYSLKFATRKILLRDASDFWIKTSAGVITVVVRKYISG